MEFCKKTWGLLTKYLMIQCWIFSRISIFPENFLGNIPLIFNGNNIFETDTNCVLVCADLKYFGEKFYWLFYIGYVDYGNIYKKYDKIYRPS